MAVADALGEPRLCPNCCRPMARVYARVCDFYSGQRIRLPDYCPDTECRKERDELALKRAIEAGVVDP